MPEQEKGNPPSQSEEGTGDKLCAPTARGLIPEEGGIHPYGSVRSQLTACPSGRRGSPPRQEDEEGASPKQRALPVHSMQGLGVPKVPPDSPRRPPDQRAPLAHRVQGRGREEGAGPQPDGERGGNPRAGPHNLRARTATGDGGKPPRPAKPPPNARRSEWEGVEEEGQGETGGRVGTPSPVGGKGAPKEQARAIVARIIHQPPGGAAHIVAKPWIFNKPNISEGLGVGAEEEGRAIEETGTGRYRGVGK